MTVSAEAVLSHITCNNEVVIVPDRGRVDIVKRTLIVKVGDSSPRTVPPPPRKVKGRRRAQVFRPFFLFQAEGVEMSQVYNWLLCPKGQRGSTNPMVA